MRDMHKGLALGVMLLAFGTVGCGTQKIGSGTDMSLPLTPAKLSTALVHRYSGGSDPAADASCDPQSTDSNGVGTYDCDIYFQAGMGWKTVVVDRNGTFTVERR